MRRIPLRAALIGTGMIGAAHLRAARDAGGEVIGVLGSSPERSRAIAEEWGLASGYPDIDALLADSPDVVHICSPNDTHLEYALAVAAAGIHVIVEKPIATTVEDAERLVEAVDAAGIVATVPFVYRFHPLVREIRARRLAGAFGDVLLVHGTYLQDWLVDPGVSTWRVDPERGGRSRAFADIGSHWADLAEFVSGEEFRDVTSSMTIAYPDRPAASGASFSRASEETERVPVGTEDIAVATFRTARGILANTVISQVSAGRKNRLWLEMDGSAGSAVFDQEQPESIWLGSERGATILRRGEGDVSPAQQHFQRIAAGHSQGWTDAFAAFCADTFAAIDGDDPDGLPTVRDGLRSARIVDAVLRGAETREWTEIGRG
jgi:predicted dehydrogenase